MLQKILSASSLTKPALREGVAFDKMYLRLLGLLALGLTDLDLSTLLGHSVKKEKLVALESCLSLALILTRSSLDTFVT